MSQKLRWQDVKKILKSLNIKCRTIRNSMQVDESTQEYYPRSKPRKRLTWVLKYDEFLYLPTMIIYTVGIPGYTLSTWNPEMIDKSSCKSLNPSSKQFYTIEELKQYIKEYTGKDI